MAKQTINIGTSANDGTGSTLREAFDITNDNFTELYDGTGGLLHKIEGTNFTGSLLVGHSTTGTLSSAQYNTGIGIAALDALTSGDQNVAIGFAAGGLLQSGSNNIAIGFGAGDALTTGSSNVAIGTQALSTEDTHGKNVAVGYQALLTQNAGADAYNVAIGYETGKLITTGVKNILIGGLAGDALTDGDSNIAIGYNALSAEDQGDRNIAIGQGALNAQNGGGGSQYNVAVGYSAGNDISDGKQNTIIGGLAGDNITTGDNNIVIGYDATASAVDVSNEVTIGNSSIANVRIPSDSTLKIGASGDLQLEHVSSNSFIKNTAVGDLYIENQVDDASIIFRCDDGSGGLDTYFSVVGAGNRVQYNKDLRLIDSIDLSLGSSDDFKINHDGTDSYIQNATGNLKIFQNANDKDITFYNDDGSGGTTTYFFLDGSRADGTYLYTEFPDNSIIGLGNDTDLQIYHSGTNSLIDNFVGDLIIQQRADDKDIIFSCDDGSGGTTEYFRLDGGNASGGVVNTLFPDNSKVVVGNDSDARFWHNGTNSFIQNITGDLEIQNYANDSDIVFQSDDGSGGIAEYFRVDGGSEEIIFSKDSDHLDNVSAYFGTDKDLRIHHNGSHTFISNNQGGDLRIIQNVDDGDIKFQADDGSGGTATYFEVQGTNTRTVFRKTLNLQDSVDLYLGTSSDLRLVHNSSDSVISNATGNLTITNSADDKDIIFKSDDGSGGVTEYFKIDGQFEVNKFSKNVQFLDDVLAMFGNGADLTISSNGSSGLINNLQGNLTIQTSTDDGDIIFKSDDGSGGTTEYFRVDGGLEKMVSSKNIMWLDNVKAQFGDSNDLRIYHNGTNNIVESVTGNLIIQNNLDDQDIIFKTDDGSGGVTEYFRLDGSDERLTVNAPNGMLFFDNIKAKFGTSSDLEIYHDGSDSIIKDGGTGSLDILSSHVHIKSSGGGSNMAQFFSGGHSYIYANNVLRIEATTSGANITGALSITGDGSNATTLTESGSGDFTIDSADDIRLDAGGGDIVLKAGGNEFGRLSNDSTSLVIQNITSDRDIIFKGNDGGTTITPVTIDMSEGGRVGIGTTSPTTKLEVNGGTGVSSSGATFLVRQKGDTSSDGIAITSSNALSHRIFKDAAGTFFIGPSSDPTAFTQSLSGNVGIGTSSPASKLEVDGGDIEVDDSASGLILRSPNGTRYRVTVDNSGNLVRTAL